MKRKLLLLLCIVAIDCLRAVSTFAQTTPASAIWALTSASPQGFVTTGLITGTNMAVNGLLINGYTGPGSSQRIKVNPDWPAFQKTEIPTVYVQFAVTTPANAIFHADSIAMSLAANSTQSMKANIYYSTDPTFATKTQINYTTGLKILASGATAPDTSYNVISNTVQFRVKASSLGLTVTAGQTLYLRIYPWLDNSNSTSGKYFCLQNVVIGGSLESLPVASNVVWGYNPTATFINTGPIYGQTATYSTLMKYYNKIAKTILNTSIALTSGELYPVSNSWPANATINDSLYFQYSCYPKTGGKLAVKSVSMYLGCRFASDLKASVYYSNDSKFATRTLLIADTTLNPNFMVPLSANLANADTVHTGEVFYLRVYPHSMSAYAAGSYKMIDVDSLRISGFVSGAPSDPPAITGAKITYVSNTFATCGGTISTDGGAAVTARGVCWNTSANPSITNSKTSNGTGTGTFISKATGLTAGTLYHIRAYATNSSGTSYGGDSTFTTLATIVIPTVTKTAASSILAISAKAGGNATAWGGDSIVAKGVCWNTTGNPTIADSKTVNGSDLGSFTSTLYPLTQSTKYYFRAYATNGAGTGYSIQDSCTTQAPSPDITKVVAKDGSGDYTTVQAAFNAVPLNYTGKWTILVKPGTYYEKDTLAAGKVNVILKSIHPDSTIITYDAYADSPKAGGGTMGTNGCQTMAIDADDFTAINVTFQNTKKNIGTGNLQAVALRTNGDRQSYFNCKIMGYQDTYYAYGGSYVGRIYMKNCYLEGSVDYIFGRDVVTFDSCEMHTNREGGAVTASSTDATSKFGFVFRNCKLTSLKSGEIGFDGKAMVSFYLGRPWQSSPRCVYITCEEPATLNSAGWTSMSVNPLLFAEYKCFGPGSGITARSTVATSASRQLTDAESNNYTLANIFSMVTNSSFGYNWKPDTTTIYKFKQTVTIANIPAKTVGDKFVPISAASSKLPVTFTSSNLNVALSGDTVKAVGLGLSTITVKQLGNYLYSAAPDSTRTLTVSTKGTLMATADNKSKTYGDVNPAFTVSYKGFVNGEANSVVTAPTVSTSATTTSSVGMYDLIVGSDGSAANYNVIPSSTPGKLTVNKVNLTAIADNKSKTYGDANPTFTVSYTGFVNSETSSVVTTAPTVTTTATAASSVGDYDLTVGTNGVAANYNIVPSSTMGKLTVNKAVLTATADNQTKVKGQANPAFTITYTGFVNGDTKASITEPNISCSADASSAAGTYDIVATGGSATNYTITNVKGTLTVTPATGIEDINATGIEIYPNPTSSVINIKRNSPDPAKFVIFNSKGQVVLEKILVSDKTSLDISTFSKGIYIIKLQDLSYKLVVQ